MLLNKTAARARAKRFGLQAAFDLAVQSGELAFRPKNPLRTYHGAPSVIAVGALLQWCEKSQPLDH